MKRIVLSILVLVFCLSSVIPVYSQERRRERRPPAGEQRRAVPRSPNHPPQRYDQNRRYYDRQYHYNNRWYSYIPRPYERRQRYRRGGFRIVLCQPDYWIFIGYDYRGRPLYDWVPGYCY